jgi:hypothetical protein
MRHIFISYKHEDEDFVSILEDKLKAEKFIIWTDKDLLVGEDWKQGIDDAIRSSFALIVVMTPESRASEYVTYEWAFAWGVGVKVIPIMLVKTEIHPRLETLQYLNFTTRREEKQPWGKLIERLKKLQEKMVQSELNTLLRDLENSRIAATRQKAAERLGEIRAVAAVPALIKTLDYDRSKRVQVAALEALEKIDTDESIEAAEAWRRKV